MDLICHFRLGEELIYLYVESEAQESTESQLVPPIEKYYRNSTNRLNLLFDNDLDRHSVIEIEESSNVDVSKSNIEQTSTYSVEFPQNDRFADVELKFVGKKRTKTNDAKGSILYSCEICDASFSDKTDYHKHELVHYVDYPYECTFCGDHFKRFKQLENHKLYHHTRDSSDENDSSPTTASEIEENDVYRDNTSEKQSQKKSCGEESRPKGVKNLPHHLGNNSKKNDESSKKHIDKVDQKMQSLKHNKEDIHVCEACGQTFSPSRIHKCLKPKTTPMSNERTKVIYKSFDLPYVSESNDKKVRKLKIKLKKKSCSESSNASNGKSAKKKIRVKLKSNEKSTFKCKYCDEEFSTSLKRRKHQRSTHPNEGVKYDCDKCDYSTYTKGCFTTHLKRHIKQYALFCEECNVGFFNNTELTTHDIKFHNSQPFQCAMCNDLFTSKGNLYSHIKSHDPNNSYVCEICGRTYKKNNSYKRHIARSHLGLTTKAQCSVCEKVLSSKEHLRRHMLTHTDERNWVCSTCGKCFLSKTYLTEHSRIHLGIRPYKCEICEKSFTQRGSLTIHKRSHTGERPYRCEYCSKGFVMSTLLRYHLKKCGEAKLSLQMINNSAPIPQIEYNTPVYDKLPTPHVVEPTEIDPLNNCAVIHSTK